MTHVVAPEKWDGIGRSLFLAGGIGECPDWQSEIAASLAATDLAVINPRRKSYPIDYESAAEEQIAWEYGYLKNAWGVAFWFPPQTLCPIALFELGTRLATRQRLFVGVDPAYRRRKDIEIQLRLARPEIRIVYALPELTEQILAAAKEQT